MTAAAAPELRLVEPPAEHLPAAVPARRTHVLLVTEGTYPFHWGGVSTWCHALTHGLPEVDFTLVALARDPLVRSVFDLAPNVVELRTIPLWGVRNAWELGPPRSLGTVRRLVRSTRDAPIAADFIPPFLTVVRELLGTTRDDAELAAAVGAIHAFVQEHDFDATFRSRAVWDALCVQIARSFPSAAESRGYGAREATLADVGSGLSWLYHWFFPLSQPLPRADVVHTAMIGSCTLLAAAAKLVHGTPFLLSEHGIYLRERYLAEHRSTASLFRKLLLLGFARRMTELGYGLADVVSPCCDYNRRWELHNGAPPELLETAYYGLESRPATPRRPAGDAPVVVWAGRIDPLKDLETLLRAAARVLEARPGVRFRLFGNAGPGREEYHRRCLDLHRELALGDAVTWEGFRTDAADAIADGDLVVLSSISEGFPFTILEAMHSGKPVVATAVGGVAEQIPPSCGVTVEPRDPEALAQAVLGVLDDPDACAARGQAARERAETLFSAERFRATHHAFYGRLAATNGNGGAPSRDAATLSVPTGPRALADTTPEHLARREELADELAAEVAQPVDPLELAAVAESHGITDRGAQARFGTESTFALAEALFPAVVARRGRNGAPSAAETAEDGSARRLELALGLFALAPLVVLLCTIAAFAEAGWDRGRLFALSLGMTASAALAHGFVGAVARRTALYLGLGYRRLAAKLVTVETALAAAAITAVGVVLYALASALDAFAADERLVFLLGALGFAAVGLAVANLSLARATGWVCAGLAAGVGSAVATRQLAGSGSGRELLLALGVGVAAALVVMLVAAGRVFGTGGSAPPLPSRGDLVVESAPYLAYGLAFMAFLLEIHVLGWAGDVSAAASRMDAIAALEVGLTLALPPVILATGVAERALRLFWLRARELQDDVPASAPRRYGSSLRAFYVRHLLVYLGASAAVALVMTAAVELALRSGWLAEWVSLPDVASTELVFVAALLAFWLVGWAQFNCMFVVNLGRPAEALPPVLLGMVVAAVTGVPLVAARYDLAAFAFVAGAAAFAWASSVGCRRVLEDADHRYATAF